MQRRLGIKFWVTYILLVLPLALVHGLLAVWIAPLPPGNVHYVEPGVWTWLTGFFLVSFFDFGRGNAVRNAFLGVVSVTFLFVSADLLLNHFVRHRTYDASRYFSLVGLGVVFGVLPALLMTALSDAMGRPASRQ